MQKFYIYSLQTWVSTGEMPQIITSPFSQVPTPQSGRLKADLVCRRRSVESIRPCVPGGWLAGLALPDQSLARRWSVTHRVSS